MKRLSCTINYEKQVPRAYGKVTCRPHTEKSEKLQYKPKNANAVSRGTVVQPTSVLDVNPENNAFG